MHFAVCAAETPTSQGSCGDNPHGTLPRFQKVVRVGGECGQEDDVCIWFAMPIMAPDILFPEQ
jgi:hypothetical protein